jgi:hypothetical protein
MKQPKTPFVAGKVPQFEKSKRLQHKSNFFLHPKTTKNQPLSEMAMLPW